MPFDFLGQLSISNDNSTFELRAPYIIQSVSDTSLNKNYDLGLEKHHEESPMLQKTFCNNVIALKKYYFQLWKSIHRGLRIFSTVEYWKIVPWNFYTEPVFSIEKWGR